MPRIRAYNKEETLEHLFLSLFDPSAQQTVITFTRQEVRAAILATGGSVPDNLNNFVKDLTRSGVSDPRSSTARISGYLLREGSHRGTMGEFFKPSTGDMRYPIAVNTAPSSPTLIHSLRIDPKVADLIRDDEGGLLSVLDYSGVLSKLVGYGAGEVKRVQSPVKLQPYELDGFFVLVTPSRRVAIPCEAKSKGRDAITINQVVGGTRTALQRLLYGDMRSAIPIAAKILQDGDVHIAIWGEYTAADLDSLPEKITTGSIVVQARVRFVPKPPRW